MKFGKCNLVNKTGKTVLVRILSLYGVFEKWFTKSETYPLCFVDDDMDKVVTACDRDNDVVTVEKTVLHDKTSFLIEANGKLVVSTEMPVGPDEITNGLV